MVKRYKLEQGTVRNEPFFFLLRPGRSLGRLHYLCLNLYGQMYLHISTAPDKELV